MCWNWDRKHRSGSLFHTMVTVRTVTASLFVCKEDLEDFSRIANKIKMQCELLASVRRELLDGPAKAVQTVRLSCNPIEEFVDFRNESVAFEKISKLASIAKDHGIEFLSLGPMRNSEFFHLVPQILQIAKNANLSACLDHNGPPDLERAQRLANAILKISDIEPNGAGNFRFCMASHVPSGTPFFPASFFSSNEDDLPSFSIGLESSDILVEIVDALLNHESAETFMIELEKRLTKSLAEKLRSVADVCEKFSAKANFIGIDASINPSLESEAIGTSFATALSKLRNETSSTIGMTGSLTLSRLITRSIQRAAEEAKIQLAGFSGLMLPQMEDRGLANAAKNLTIQNLLLYSAVCGVGIDTVPIPGETPPLRLAMLLLDVWSLSMQWNKSLSCRVLPVAGKRAGEIVSFGNPYLCDSIVMAVE